MKNQLTNSCLEAITMTVGALGDLDARAISARLSRAGSEFQAEVMNRDGSRTPIVLVRDGLNRVASWAATRTLDGLATLEGFTIEERRRQGLFAVATSMLIGGGLLCRDQPLIVFTIETMTVAVDLKFTDVRLYRPLRWSPPGESRPQG